MAAGSQNGPDYMLQYINDMYGGVRVDSKNQEYDLDEEFEERLTASIAHWESIGVGGVWVKISRDHGAQVPVCIRHGFDFHHAQPGYVMMTRWLLTDKPSILPAYANQYLGCAGFVVNERNEVLVVKERYSSALAKWKLPGGHANAGENLAETALRETLEETGVQCEFVALLCIRHMHGYKYGLSDLYAICLLKPLSQKIQIDAQELQDAQWMDVEDWLSGDITGINRFSGELYQEIRQDLSQALVAHTVPSWDKKRVNYVYSCVRPNSNSSESTTQEIVTNEQKMDQNSAPSKLLNL